MGGVFLLANPVWTAFVHASYCRFPKFAKLPRQFVTALAISTLILAQTLSGFFFLEDSKSRLDLIYPFLVAILSGHVYFHIFNMSETARRIRILLKIKKGESVLPTEHYSSRQMIEIRLKRLVDLKQISLKEGIYRYRPSVLLVAAVILKKYESTLFKRRDQMPHSHPQHS